MADKTFPEKFAEETGGKLDKDSVMALPDGSGCFTMSFPLPASHWALTDPNGYNTPPMLLRMRHDDPRRIQWRVALIAAGKYAYRASTMNGKEPDMDPDALLQNLVVGLFGYHTEDGLSGDDWANPSPIPPLLP